MSPLTPTHTSMFELKVRQAFNYIMDTSSFGPSEPIGIVSDHSTATIVGVFDATDLLRVLCLAKERSNGGVIDYRKESSKPIRRWLKWCPEMTDSQRLIQIPAKEKYVQSTHTRSMFANYRQR